MCVKLSPENLNPSSYPPHLISNYNCRMTIAPRMCGGLIYIFIPWCDGLIYIFIWALSLLDPSLSSNVLSYQPYHSKDLIFIYLKLKTSTLKGRLKPLPHTSTCQISFLHAYIVLILLANSCHSHKLPCQPFVHIITYSTIATTACHVIKICHSSSLLSAITSD